MAFDPLDMNNYKVEKLPKMQKSSFEKWMARLGGPLALIAFVLLYWFVPIGFIDNLNPDLLTAKALKRANEIGMDAFIRSNYAMFAIFVASLILWMTEAIPNYLTSLLLILGTVLCNVTTQKEALAQLGHPVMWLNILSFVLASMLVKTQFAKRLALAFVIKFGKKAKGVLWSFLIINLVLSAFISATTVKATIMLPIFMTVCAIYGASGDNRNNFGRNLVIQNLFQVNVGANAFYTGSGAHLLAISLIAGFIGSCDFGYADWLIAVGPMSVIILVVGLLLGMYLFFPMKKEEQHPQIEGGLDRLKKELDAMGKMKAEEYKAVGIFVLVLFLWVTKGTFHNIDETIVALLGAIIALMSDSDETVAATACRGAGDHYNDKIIEPIAKILKDDSKAKIHGDCVRSLVKLWIDSPSYEHRSEAAYKATMDYFKKTPRTSDVPNWLALSAFNSITVNDNFAKWKQEATYFNQDEFTSVMSDLIKDENFSGSVAKGSAMTAIATMGGKAELEKIRPMIQSLSDDSIKETYGEKLAEAK